MKNNFKALCWVFELVILAAVCALFWKVNVFFSISIFIFHGLVLMQVFKVQNLLGNLNREINTKQKILNVLLVLVFFICLAIQVIKGVYPSAEKIEEITNSQIVDLANGELFPFIIVLCVLAALLMFGIAAERRRR